MARGGTPATVANRTLLETWKLKVPPTNGAAKCLIDFIREDSDEQAARLAYLKELQQRYHGKRCRLRECEEGQPDKQASDHEKALNRSFQPSGVILYVRINPVHKKASTHRLLGRVGPPPTPFRERKVMCQVEWSHDPLRRLPASSSCALEKLQILP